MLVEYERNDAYGSPGVAALFCQSRLSFELALPLIGWVDGQAPPRGWACPTTVGVVGVRDAGGCDQSNSGSHSGESGLRRPVQTTAVAALFLSGARFFQYPFGALKNENGAWVLVL